MNNGYIAVLDSGIGGISVLNELIKTMPNENYLYFGDSDNAPYGNRTDRDLTEIAVNNINYLNRFNVKAVVLGCNTLSVRVLYKIKDLYPFKIFGIFPPVESCLTKGNTLLLSTVSTASKYNNKSNRLFSIGLRSLAKNIENQKFNLETVNIQNELHDSICNFDLKKINALHFDNVILGCTHYYFVKNKIFDHFNHPNLISGAHFTVKKVYEFLKNTKSLGNSKGNSVLFVGNNKCENSIFYNKVVKFNAKL